MVWRYADILLRGNILAELGVTKFSSRHIGTVHLPHNDWSFQ